MNETLLSVLALVPALVIAIVFHEVAHGYVALLLGDPTALEQRRLSLNPLRHVDLFGTLVLPGMLALAGLPVFGWAKPVPVNQRRLRNPRFGMMAVAIAGPLTNLVLATVGAVALGLLARGLSAAPGPVATFFFSALQGFILINIFLALFNLLPIPPFDGSHVVEGVLPRGAARAYASSRRYAFPAVIALLVVLPWLFPQLDVVQRLVGPPVGWALEQYQALAMAVAGR
jgi:Zn-dependent protease